MIASGRTLGSLVSIQGGGTPDRKTSAFWNGDIPWASVKDLKGFTLTSTSEHITSAGVESSATSIVPTGSVIVATRMGLGKACINEMPVAINQDLKALVCHAELEARYLLYFLLHKAPRLEQMGHGATVKGYRQEYLLEMRVPVPSVLEQRRIADMLDQADGLRRKRRESLALTASLIPSIFHSMFGDPIANPRCWPIFRLGSVARFVGGGTPSRARPDFYSGSICWATSKDMKSDILDDTEEHITEQAIQESATNLVPPNTILVVVKSKILAHRLPVAISQVPTCFGQDLKGISLTDHFDVAFVATSLRIGERWFLARARGVNTEGLTLEHLSSFPMIAPPVDLQREFAARVAEVRALEDKQRASLRDLDALFNSLLHKAFHDELIHN